MYGDYRHFNRRFMDNLADQLHYPSSCMPYFSNQMFLRPKDIVVLSSLGLMTITKFRPLDLLCSIFYCAHNNEELLYKNCSRFIREFGLYNVRLINYHTNNKFRPAIC